jgi:hypothetical protein
MPAVRGGVGGAGEVPAWQQGRLTAATERGGGPLVAAPPVYPVPI